MAGLIAVRAIRRKAQDRKILLPDHADMTPWEPAGDLRTCLAVSALDIWRVVRPFQP
jgi:hypothetical protein